MWLWRGRLRQCGATVDGHPPISEAGLTVIILLRGIAVACLRIDLSVRGRCGRTPSLSSGTVGVGDSSWSTMESHASRVATSGRRCERTSSDGNCCCDGSAYSFDGTSLWIRWFARVGRCGALWMKRHCWTRSEEARNEAAMEARRTRRRKSRRWAGQTSSHSSRRKRSSRSRTNLLRWWEAWVAEAWVACVLPVPAWKRSRWCLEQGSVDRW